jgi:hypothetical protein
VKHHVHGAPGKSAKILAVVYIPFWNIIFNV